MKTTTYVFSEFVYPFQWFDVIDMEKGFVKFRMISRRQIYLAYFVGVLFCHPMRCGLLNPTISKPRKRVFYNEFTGRLFSFIFRNRSADVTC